MSGRRRFVTGIAAALAAPGPSWAQAKPTRVVALARSPIPEIGDFRDQMRLLGRDESQTWILEESYADGAGEARLRAVTEAAIRRAPDLIWAGHSEAAVQAKRITSSIPIVFHASDPVRLGLVASMAKPGGNATGIVFGDAELVGKRMEILHDAFPLARRIAFLHSESAANRIYLDVARRSAGMLKVELVSVIIPETGGPAAAVDEAVRRGADGITLNTSPLVRSQAPSITARAAQHRVPLIYEDSAAVDGGGLMSYGPDRRRMARRTAVFVDRILRGARPGDIPVERWDRFELVINLKTAAALGFTVPPSLVALADRVIE